MGDGGVRSSSAEGAPEPVGVTALQLARFVGGGAFAIAGTVMLALSLALVITASDAVHHGADLQVAFTTGDGGRSGAHTVDGDVVVGEAHDVRVLGWLAVGVSALALTAGGLTARPAWATGDRRLRHPATVLTTVGLSVFALLAVVLVIIGTGQVVL